MTHDQAFKTAARERAASRGINYTAARREILDQLAEVAEFGHLPVIWESARVRVPFVRPPRERHQLALGAIELAIRESGALEGAMHRDRWRTLDSHIDLDWDGGPYAHEVLRELIAFAEAPDTGTVDPGQLRPGVSLLGDLNAVWISGVRVRFRPYKPIGAETARAQTLAGIRARTTTGGITA
ncbi:hypothetical protein [Amycolatopsis sp. NBC_01480]|uniref:hypothetical protein n=1 Tax=Amycolatopsis sp. NBC_01480 TaxID=2903562 RepID=UPI002E2A4C77|nr:hypothetical protein [Amycolatopsis sp. NBC_01480]